MVDDMRAVVAAAEPIADGIRRFELRAQVGILPPVAAGSHVVMTTPAGHRRSYSVTEQTADGGYVICVARDNAGRGGSISMHDDLHAGDGVAISPAHNAFPLQPADSYLLIAGGIGITPIRSMYHALREHPRVRMIYLSRSPQVTAFAEEFADRDNVSIHYSSEGRLDLWSRLGVPDDETHVYCCASTGLMDHVRLLTMHWNPAQIHFEDFNGVKQAPGDPFVVEWDPDHRQIEVAPEQSLLYALRDAGIAVDSSCESGTCGTCELRLVNGEAEHRDLVLSEDERRTRIITCVSRGSGTLTLAPRGRSAGEDRNG